VFENDELDNEADGLDEEVGGAEKMKPYIGMKFIGLGEAEKFYKSYGLRLDLMCG
jgi:hypothetical protein